MIEVLILFELNRKILTMYGISKQIRNDFSVLTTPSLGTINPALKRLLSSEFIRKQKTISEGGRPSYYYSITDSGVKELKRLLLEPPMENPIQFLPSARVKIACADVLDSDEQLAMIKLLKQKAESIMIDTNSLMNSSDLSYYPRMIFDNLSCEYKNFISLLEGFEHACTRK